MDNFGRSRTYDGSTSELQWEVSATGAQGAVWFADLPTGSTTITVTSPLAADRTITLPVGSDTITFATVEIP